MERKFYCVFVAGGSGTRMKSELPKQFIPLSGVPILQRTIERFLDAAPDMHVITVLPARNLDTWKEICSLGSLDVPQTIVTGGITRFHSVQNALKKVPDGAIVAIHDGVRPLVSVALIREMRRRMSECRALIPVVPVTDTLRSINPSEPDPDRSKIVAVQTPQMFLSEHLKAAYRQPYSTLFTDDASVAAANGISLSFIDGERYNLKITTPEDLGLAEYILTL